MSFPPNAGAVVSLNDAAAMTAEFRHQNPDAIKCWLVDANLIQTMLNQTDCKGIRMYNAINEGQKTLVIVGVDSNGNDLTDYLIEFILPCPRNCSADNPLNC